MGEHEPFTMDEVKTLHAEWHRFDFREGDCPGPETCSYGFLFARIAALERERDELRCALRLVYEGYPHEPCISIAAEALDAKARAALKGA